MLGCASEKVEKLIPYLVSPDQTVPGVSTYYATTCRECAAACGLIAETRDGRTIKLEGNPEHPVNRGALCARGQAALQGLYNPDRFRGPMVRRNGALEAIDVGRGAQLFAQKLGETRSRGGAANAVFLNQHESGKLSRVSRRLARRLRHAGRISASTPRPITRRSRRTGRATASRGRARLHAPRSSSSRSAPTSSTAGARSVPQQLDFADARAKLEERAALRLRRAAPLAHRPERRPVDRLQAGQRAGDRRTRSPAQAARRRRPRRRPASPPRRSTRSRASSLREAEPGARRWRGADALELALAVDALNQSRGNVGVTIKPAEARSRLRRHRALADSARAASSGCTPGRCRSLFVRGANPAYTLPKSVGFADGVREGAVQGQLLELSRRDDGAVRSVLPDHHSLE